MRMDLHVAVYYNSRGINKRFHNAAYILHNTDLGTMQTKIVRSELVHTSLFAHFFLVNILHPHSK